MPKQRVLDLFDKNEDDAKPLEHHPTVEYSGPWSLGELGSQAKSNFKASALFRFLTDGVSLYDHGPTE